eukprot:7126749-Pyramimonas_sp.AAC.1
MPSKSDTRANLGAPCDAALVSGARGADGTTRFACTQRMPPETAFGNVMGCTLVIMPAHARSSTARIRALWVQ